MGLTENLEEVRKRIASACERAGRNVEEVKLIAVSKTYPPKLIEEACTGAQLQFGESRLQEAEEKVAKLPNNLEWHFIGKVQRNKVRKILPLFPYIHAIDSMKLAKYLDGVARETGITPKVFLQINQAMEQSKGGFLIDELRANFVELMNLKNIEIIGLMSIPPAGDHADESRTWFTQLRLLKDELNTSSSASMVALSMGMSNDFEVAIEEGATHVRVGSLIFGERSKKLKGELG